MRKNNGLPKLEKEEEGKHGNSLKITLHTICSVLRFHVKELVAVWLHVIDVTLTYRVH